MTMSEMTHRVTDAIKRMTYRLTHRKDTQPKSPSDKDSNLGSGVPSKWDNLT
jgi:hypothetical protein